MIKIYMEHVTIEREKIKALGLVGPTGKRGCFSTFMVHLDLVGMRVVLRSYCEPLRLAYGPLSYLVLALLLCVPLV